MLNIVFIDKKPRVFYNDTYVGFLENHWFYVSPATRKYVEQSRKVLKSLYPNLNIYWMNRPIFWNKDIYGEEQKV